MAPEVTDCCPICNRPYSNVHDQNHHLVPKTFGGRETVRVHAICHQKIHATFSERDLAHYYFTIPRILSHDEIQKFVKWVKKKDPAFYDKNDDTADRRRKR